MGELMIDGLLVENKDGMMTKVMYIVGDSGLDSHNWLDALFWSHLQGKPQILWLWHQIRGYKLH